MPASRQAGRAAEANRGPAQLGDRQRLLLPVDRPEWGVALEDIDLWVPHQANFRIIDAAARRIGLPLDRVAINIDEYGNTSSASIPLALEEAIRKGRVKSGDHVLLAGFGSGLTWGATLLKWA